MKTLWNKMDKRELAVMPRVLFEGRIIVVQTEAEAEKAVRYLMSQDMLGFDTETRPNFRPGPMHPVALLQVATHDTCFLFRLNLMGLPPCLVRLLSDRKISKIALSWHDDTQQLRRRQDFEVGEFIELQDYATAFGIEDKSLQKLYGNVFGQRISKTQQLTNWDADVLTEAQKRYAAIDAWACIRIYEELERLRLTNDYRLEIRKTEDNNVQKTISEQG